MIQKSYIAHIFNIIKRFKKNPTELYTPSSNKVEESIIMKLFTSNQTLLIISSLSYIGLARKKTNSINIPDHNWGIISSNLP